MRSDMKKVVVERPRGGSWKPNRKFGARLRYIPDHDYEEEVKRVGISQSYRYKWGEKWFTDVLGPLRKFLHSRVGRPWDEVYSELCAGLDKRKATGRHIFVHVDAMVEKHCHTGDSRTYICGKSWSRDSFYVDPRTGLLCLAARLDKEQRMAWRQEYLLRNPITKVKLAHNIFYERHNGFWYRVRYENIRIGEPCGYHWDILANQRVRLKPGLYCVAVEKKQCGRAELAKVKTLLRLAESKRRL